ncbi:MAG: tryptophan synthase subunit alpha, partial [Acidimicrobiaceae bacterium]
MKIATHSPGVLEARLRNIRNKGRKILVPYITGGLMGWVDAVRGAAANGADAIEIGIPFSDPVMDGPIIQMASEKALRDGATPNSILHELRTIDVAVPLI